jgi:hypothetical protein
VGALLGALEGELADAAGGDAELGEPVVEAAGGRVADLPGERREAGLDELGEGAVAHAAEGEGADALDHGERRHQPPLGDAPLRAAAEARDGAALAQAPARLLQSGALRRRPRHRVARVRVPPAGGLQRSAGRLHGALQPPDLPLPPRPRARTMSVGGAAGAWPSAAQPLPDDPMRRQ